jgi:hypothetical protein
MAEYIEYTILGVDGIRIQYLQTFGTTDLLVETIKKTISRRFAAQPVAERGTALHYMFLDKDMGHLISCWIPVVSL